MLLRVLGLAAASAAYSSAAVAEEGGFELLSGIVDGNSVMLFVDRNGTAVAIELSERGAQVLTGLAAGALLSEVREADGEPDLTGQALSALRAERASTKEASALIDEMTVLNDTQKARLRTALAL
ncbi:hypothetical protein [Parvularcula oceani]|uniref:hypothetical protein n=1 Tax=Parvularcula oceani TaxID=1247963 RepID=UPI0004E1EF3C|nr:hypothetical protein [Parvularcula oceani]